MGLSKYKLGGRMADAWPFPDPENLATFTVGDVLTGHRPVLYVSHDVADGSWQFLTGEALEPNKLKLVCLADVVKTDASLVGLADLPLGWSAERRSRDEPWTRQPTFPTVWGELLARAEAYTTECQERLKEEFSLLDWERYDYNQESASLIFSSAGVPRVTMKIQIVGSWARGPGTWLWSWDNDSILPGAAEYVHVLRRFGEQHDFERLSRPLWPAEEVDGWEMTSVACLLLQGEGVYRSPDQDAALFMVVSEPAFIQG
jgi:hypothetical protein